MRSATLKLVHSIARPRIAPNGKQRFFGLGIDPENNTSMQGVNDDVSGKLCLLPAQSAHQRQLAQGPSVGSTAVFDWNCFLGLMKEHADAAAEEATWKGSRDTKTQ
jgi:hypothetical protein